MSVNDFSATVERAPLREIPDGTPTPCCGCPIVRADAKDKTWLGCDCRCHDSAKALYRATTVHPVAS